MLPRLASASLTALLRPANNSGLSRTLAVAAAQMAGGSGGDTSAALLHFCVVGSGPAGFYTADKLLKRFGADARVDVVEALPTPFGLVRSGVAPDHADTKNVINQFTALATNPRLTFLGNVRVGRDIGLPELRAHYNAVVLCYGAESDRRLGVPGEELPGVLSAREFVWWYNGHPGYRDLPIDLSSTRSVAIAGLGNVAVDCARILLKAADEVAVTDICSHAVEQLRASAVKEVHLLGRRGPVQAAFTPKELRELLGLKGVKVVMDPNAFQLSPECEAEMKATRMKKRVFELLSKTLAEPRQGERSLHIHFLRTPVAVVEQEGRASGVKVEKTRLEAAAQPGGASRALGTGEYETVPADLVLKSIGFKSVGIPGVAFDERAGVVPNLLGQVYAEGDSSFDPGLYVCGWLKRGPSGIIGTNLVDAEQTVDTMLRTRDSFPAVQSPRPGSAGLKALLEQRGVQAVSFQGWQRVDAAEVQRGQAQGKPREKITDVQEMLQLAAGAA
ncbi:hypothetical protein D9Q98_001319 [Chlorella vulgaris]|uniref:NADPH:adrenodoxin oxidoreductase, mitochondrial n=1 Tax=Chlorella vulgaris TaxID=3077 RepID=A0A9D4TZM9_CHLVU|nr:hypothetical protein D9Q98_001319 [Chlorella vulgaris]